MRTAGVNVVGVVFVLSLAAVGLAGCKDSPGSPEPVVELTRDPVLKPGVLVDADFEIVAVSEESVIIHGRAGLPADMVGLVLVSGHDDGFVRRVLAVTTDERGDWVLTTEPAQITDAFVELGFRAVLPATAGQLVLEEADVSQLQRSGPRRRVSLMCEDGATPPSADVEMTLQAFPAVTLDIDITGGVVTRFVSRLDGTATLDTTLSLVGPRFTSSCTATANFRLAPIRATLPTPIAPIPITFAPSVTTTFGVRGTVRSGSIEFSKGYEATMAAGLEYTPASTTKILAFDADATSERLVTEPGRLSGETSAAVNLELASYVFGLAGLRLQAKPSATLDFELDLSSCRLESGVTLALDASAAAVVDLPLIAEFSAVLAEGRPIESRVAEATDQLTGCATSRIAGFDSASSSLQWVSINPISGEYDATSTSIPSSGLRATGFEVGGRACVQSGDSTLYCVDMFEGSVVSSVPVSGLDGPVAPRSLHDVRHVSSMSGGGWSLRALNTETGQSTFVGALATSAQEGVGSYGGFHRATNQLFFEVSDATTTRLLFVDVENGQTRDSRSLSDGIGGPMLMRDDGRIIAIAGTRQGETEATVNLVTIDPGSATVRRVQRLGSYDGYRPDQVLFDEARNLVFVVAYLGAQASIIGVNMDTGDVEIALPTTRAWSGGFYVQ